MTPRDRFAVTLDTIASLSASERLILRAAADEYAAAMIEYHAHPPLPVRLGRAAVVVDAAVSGPGDAA